MLDNVRKTMATFAILIFVVGIIFCICKLISNLFTKYELPTMEEYKEYMKTENLVTDYSMNANIESICNNFILSCNKGEYEKLYNIIISKYKKEYKKEDVINTLKTYSEKYFNDSNIFELNGKLIEAYYVNDKNEYILNINTECEDKLYIVISMDRKETKYEYALFI